MSATADALRIAALLEAVTEATVGQGGHYEIYSGIPAGAETPMCRVLWWKPSLVMEAWTQRHHPTLLAALTEAAERLGIEVGE